MKHVITGGATDQSVMVFVADSSSPVGAGLTGLVYNSSGLTAYYARTRGTATAITLATLAAADSAHSDGGFKEIDPTNMPGVYRLDLPDAVVADGVLSAVVMLKGAASMAPVTLEIQLQPVPTDVVSIAGDETVAEKLKDILATSNSSGISVDPALVLASTIDGTYTLEEVVRLMSAVLLGRSDQGGLRFYGLNGATPRVTSVVDPDLNRVSVTLSP